jgi:hypothetical protein
MQKVSAEFANATAVASGFMAVHLFKLLIEKGILGAEEAMAVLKKTRNDLALAARSRHLDQTLFEAEGLVTKMYAGLQAEAPVPAAAAPKVENRAQH